MRPGRRGSRSRDFILSGLVALLLAGVVSIFVFLPGGNPEAEARWRLHKVLDHSGTVGLSRSEKDALIQYLLSVPDGD